MKICSIASKRAAKEDAKFVQILNQPSKKLPIILRCLPKWRNSAKSGHTEHWPLLGTKQVVVVGMEIGTWKENEKMIFLSIFKCTSHNGSKKLQVTERVFFRFLDFRKDPYDYHVVQNRRLAFIDREPWSSGYVSWLLVMSSNPSTVYWMDIFHINLL